MKSAPTKQERRAGCNFECSNARPGDSQRKENIRVAQRVVIEKIVYPGAKVIRFDYPSACGNRNSKLVFFVAFAAQRGETKTLPDCQFKQWPRNCRQRWRLIVTTIESVQDPIQTRNANSQTSARAGRGFS